MDVAVERRARVDRRQRNIRPPNIFYDRRRVAERRLDHADELVLSESEWEKLFGGMPKIKSVDNPVLDQAAEVFGRAGDRH